MSNEIPVKTLIEACEKDPEMMAGLLKDPKDFALKHKVTLTDDQIKPLQLIGQLKQLIAKFEAGRVRIPPWNGYPYEGLWKQVIFTHLQQYRFPKPIPPGYPVGPDIDKPIREDVNVLRRR